MNVNDFDRAVQFKEMVGAETFKEIIDTYLIHDENYTQLRSSLFQLMKEKKLISKTLLRQSLNIGFNRTYDGRIYFGASTTRRAIYRFQLLPDELQLLLTS